jgi:hypothetical protein
MIYISTEDEIRQFSLKALDPYVWCYSTVESKEQYKMVYSFPCANPTPSTYLFMLSAKDMLELGRADLHFLGTCIS